jgi:hypothetical protein
MLGVCIEKETSNSLIGMAISLGQKKRQPLLKKRISMQLMRSRFME